MAAGVCTCILRGVSILQVEGLGVGTSKGQYEIRYLLFHEKFECHPLNALLTCARLYMTVDLPACLLPIESHVQSAISTRS